MPPASSSVSARESVLIVDDDPSARETFAAILSDDYEVDTVGDAADATVQLSRRSYQVMITDYQMPGMTGLELLTAVGTGYPNLVGILLTAHSRTREIRDFDHERRIFAILAKPCEPEKLIRTTRLAMATARMRNMNTKK